MTSRELVWRTLKFQNTDRMPFEFPEKYGSDFAWTGMSPSPDDRPAGGNGIDEWGAAWRNIGVCNLGEVYDFPLKSWSEFGKLHVPDIHEERRWDSLKGIRERSGDKFLLAFGISLYERAHFIRGLQNLWLDIYDAPQNVERLIDILTEMNLVTIRHYADAGVDGYIFCDDWGLQNRLMIQPDVWREIWKPRYARIFKAAHEAGMATFLHSCGHIVSIMDELIEVGLDVIHMDQQENMGLQLLGERFGGRITFFSPVDIQQTMARGTLDQIRAYCHKMVVHLGRPHGGFIPRWYSDPTGAGHRQEAIDAMCQEFLKIGTYAGAREM